MAESQKTKAQLLAEVTTLRQQWADLAHDIKDPLGVILGYTGILLQEASMRETRETVEGADALERINGSALLIYTLLTHGSDP